MLLKKETKKELPLYCYGRFLKAEANTKLRAPLKQIQMQNKSRTTFLVKISKGQRHLFRAVLLQVM